MSARRNAESTGEDYRSGSETKAIIKDKEEFGNAGRKFKKDLGEKSSAPA